MQTKTLIRPPAAGAAIDRRQFLAGLCSITAAAVLAGEDERRAFAPTAQLTKDGPPLVLVGAGVFRFFFIRYYRCGLYARDGLRQAQAILDADAPRRIALVALRDISAFEFLWGLDRGLADNLSADERKTLASGIEQVRTFIRSIGGIAAGARVALDYLPQTGLRFLLDDHPRGPLLAGKALADALAKVWIGERPLDATLKADLLAG